MANSNSCPPRPLAGAAALLIARLLVEKDGRCDPKGVVTMHQGRTRTGADRLSHMPPYSLL